MFHLFQPAEKNSLTNNTQKIKSLDDAIDECLSIGIVKPVTDFIESAPKENKPSLIERAIKKFIEKNGYVFAKNIAYHQPYQVCVPDILLVLIKQFAAANGRPQVNEILYQENDSEERIKLMTSAMEGYLQKEHYNEFIKFLRQEKNQEILKRSCKRSLYAIVHAKNADFLQKLYALFENETTLFSFQLSLIYEAAYHDNFFIRDSLLKSYESQSEKCFNLIEGALSGCLRGGHGSEAVKILLEYKNISLPNDKNVFHEYVRIFFKDVIDENFHYASWLLSLAKPEDKLKCYKTAVYLLPQRNGKILLNQLWKANFLLDRSVGFDAEQINVLKLHMAEGIVASAYLSAPDKLKAFKKMDEEDSTRTLDIWSKVIEGFVSRESLDFIKLIPNIDKSPLFEKLVDMLSRVVIAKAMDREKLLAFIVKFKMLDLPDLAKGMVNKTQIIGTIDVSNFLQGANEISNVMQEFSIDFNRAFSVYAHPLDNVRKIIKMFSCDFERAYAARDMNVDKIQEIMHEFGWNFKKALSAYQIWSLPLTVRWFLNTNMPFTKKLRIAQLEELLNISEREASALYDANEKNKIALIETHTSLFKAASTRQDSPVYKAAKKAESIRAQEMQDAEKSHPRL